MKNFIFILLLLITYSVSFSQSEVVWLHPNKGQWHENILYQVNLDGGKMYVEPTGFTYHFYENPRGNHDHTSKDEPIENPDHLKQHVVKSTYIGSSWGHQVIEENKSAFYNNYYLGNNSASWKTALHSYGKVTLNDFYPSINLQLIGAQDQLKYAFIVLPNASPTQIQWKVEGADQIKLNQDGSLIYTTSLGEIKETKPIAWTVKNGDKTAVPTRFKQHNNIISFEFPSGYSQNDTLIIDPYLVFSTFTGSTSDNWGMTATPGPNGEMYAGGICFGAGYPTTTGAIDATYNGGTAYNNITGFDVSISKFSADGTQLLFSTYLGGSANELPESMICTATGDLYVLGITASTDFPLGVSPYQSTLLGDQPLPIIL